MLIGIPKEPMAGETRVAATPKTVAQLLKLGYDVCVEAGAGLAANFNDQDYIDAGAQINTDTKSVCKRTLTRCCLVHFKFSIISSIAFFIICICISICILYLYLYLYLYLHLYLYPYLFLIYHSIYFHLSIYLSVILFVYLASFRLLELKTSWLNSWIGQFGTDFDYVNLGQ